MPSFYLWTIVSISQEIVVLLHINLHPLQWRIYLRLSERVKTITLYFQKAKEGPGDKTRVGQVKMECEVEVFCYP